MTIIYIIVVIITIIVIYYAYTVQGLVVKKLKRKIDVDVNQADIDDTPFSFDIYYKSPELDINIDNPDDCNYTTPKRCKLDDFTSCEGCKQLTASCVHQERDITFINTEGDESILEANVDPNEGYCLDIETISEKCNPYHGKFILVQTSPGSSRAFLLCDCNKPGFIGNLIPGDSCEDVFICNGKIDYLNQPFEDIRCNCDSLSYSTIELGIPTCELKRIKDATDADIDTLVKLRLGDAVQDPVFIPTLHFNKDIIDSLPNLTRLMDPCQVCQITGLPTDARATTFTPVLRRDFEEGGGGWITMCTTSAREGEEKPFKNLLICRRGIEDDYNKTVRPRLLRGMRGPDAALVPQVEAYGSYGYFDNLFDCNAFATLDTSLHDTKTFLKKLGVNRIDELRHSRFIAIDLFMHQFQLGITAEFHCKRTNEWAVSLTPFNDEIWRRRDSTLGAPIFHNYHVGSNTPSYPVHNYQSPLYRNIYAKSLPEYRLGYNPGEYNEDKRPEFISFLNENIARENAIGTEIRPVLTLVEGDAVHTIAALKADWYKINDKRLRIER